MRFLIILILNLVLTDPLSAEERPSLEQALPPESLAVLLIDDIATWLQIWPQSAWGRCLDDPKIKAFFDPLVLALNLHQWETRMFSTQDLGLDHMADVFQGSVAIAFWGLDQSWSSSDDPNDMLGSSVLLADVAGAEKKAHDMIQLLIDADRQEVESGGHSLDVAVEEEEGVPMWITVERQGQNLIPGDCWALCQSVFILASDRRVLKETIARIKTPSANLTHTAAWKSASSSGRDARFFLWCHLPPLMSQLMEDLDQEHQSQASVFNPRSLFDSLGLSDLQALSFSAGLEADATHCELRLNYQEPQALMEALIPEKPLAQQWSALPGVPKNVVTASLGQFDLEKLWHLILKIALAIDPEAESQLKAMVLGFGMSAGIHFEEDVIKNLSGLFWAVSLPGETGPSHSGNDVMAWSIKQPAKIKMLIDHFSKMLSPTQVTTEEETEDGVLFYSFKTNSDQALPIFHYTFFQDYFIYSVGGSQSLKSVVRSMKKNNHSFWNSPRENAGLKQRYPQAQMLAWADFPFLVDRLLRTLSPKESNWSAYGPDDTPSDQWPWLDFEQQPTLGDWRAYFGPMLYGISRTRGQCQIQWTFLGAPSSE